MDIMEIKELVSYSVNETTQTLDVTFRLIEDSDDEIRTDQIGLDEIKKFGYSFLDNGSIKFSDLFEEDEEYADFDDFDDDDEYLEESIDEGEVVSFLTEYYMVNSKNLQNRLETASAVFPNSGNR
jgi:hypothetical protein